MFPELWTVLEVADRWSCHRMSVYRAGLPFYRVGGQVRFSRSDVECFELEYWGYYVGG